MEALKTFDIAELLKRQKMLDEKFDKKETVRERTIKGIRIAYFGEYGELLQETKSKWNYWKNSCKEINKQRALEELSDCLHFALSYVNNDYFNSLIRNKDIRFQMLLFEQEEYDFETVLEFLSNLYNNADQFAMILILAKKMGATEQEFLKVHHEVWLRNMGERTREEY